MSGETYGNKVALLRNPDDGYVMLGAAVSITNEIWWLLSVEMYVNEY